MIKLRAKYHLSEKETELLKDTDTKESHYDYLIDYDCDCYLPNGEPLFFFRKNFVDYEILKEAYLNMLSAAKVTNNRGLSSSSEKKQATLKSGKKSKQVYIYDKETGEREVVNSGLAGFFDRKGRYDFCRTTAFNKDHLDKFEKALPLIHEVDRGFKEIVPDRYKKQLAMAKGTHPNYVIKDTAFTTVTINKNWRTPYHTDQGDYAKGFGNLVAYCKDVEPVLFIMPRFKIAIDLRTCDLLLADVHQYHGNSPIIKRSKNAVRLSFVMYYRENMIKCKSPSEELRRSQMNQRINFLKQSGIT